MRLYAKLCGVSGNKPKEGEHVEMINAKELVYSYDFEGSERRSLDGISLTVQRGELVAVLGHNGCGKTTLARHLNALLPMQGGELTIAGNDARDENRVWQIRKSCGMVFQNPDNQIVAAVVEEDVAFGPENLGVPSEEIRQRVQDALKRVNMTIYAKHGPHLLSGGQKQRIAIARAVLKNAPVLILDEATAFADPDNEARVQAAFTELSKGKTVIMIAHRLSTVQNSDVIMVLDHGRIIERGSHKKLIEEKGKYYQLYTGAFELE